MDNTPFVSRSGEDYVNTLTKNPTDHTRLRGVRGEGGGREEHIGDRGRVKGRGRDGEVWIRVG